MRLFKEIGEKKGIALIMALWIMTILLVVAASFTFMMRTEVKMAGNYRNGVKAHYLALAGVDHAIAMLLADTGNTDHYGEAWHTTFRKDWIQADVTWDALPISYGGGTYAVHLSDENSKLNLNYANASGIKFLVATGGGTSVYFYRKACNICDYRDGAQPIPPFISETDDAGSSWENAVMTYGGQSGSENAGCKNNFFDTVYEIQKVTGINWGTSKVYDNPLDEGNRGSASDMTVYSQDRNTQVNGTARSVDVKTATVGEFVGVGFSNAEATLIVTERTNDGGFVDYGYPLVETSPVGGMPPTTMGAGAAIFNGTGGSLAGGLLDASVIGAVDRMTAGNYDSGIIKGTININTGTIYGLRGLINIDVTKTAAIIAARNTTPFTHRGIIMNVTGIGRGIFQDNGDIITVRSDRFRIYSTGKVGIDGNSDGDLEDSVDTVFAARKIEAVVDRHYYDTPFQTPGPVEVLYWSEKVFED